MQPGPWIRPTANRIESPAPGVAVRLGLTSLLAASPAGALLWADPPRPNPFFVAPVIAEDATTATDLLGRHVSSAGDAAASQDGPPQTQPTPIPLSGAAAGPALIAQPSSGQSVVWSTLLPSLPATDGSVGVSVTDGWAVRHDAPSGVPAKPFLTNSSVDSKRAQAAAAIQSATQELRVGAWAGATEHAWSAVRLATESIDAELKSHGQPPIAAAALQAGQDAVREAKDFRGPFAADDPDVIARMVRSHRTPLLKDRVSQPQAMRSLTTVDAADLYLNEARRNFSVIAARSVQAAHALDLLATTHAVRDDASPLNREISLTLRRAAFQGQPGNATLAVQLGRQLIDVGLYREAGFALEQAMNVVPSVDAAEMLSLVHTRIGDVDRAAAYQSQSRLIARQTPPRPAGVGVPEILRVSPAEFAAMSSLQPTTMMAAAPPAPAADAARPAAAASEPVTAEIGSEATPGPIRRAMSTMGRMW